MNKPRKIDLKQIRTYPVSSRRTKSEIGQFARVPSSNWEIGDFLDGLPDYLKAVELKGLIADILQAKQNGKACILMMGAHALKVGLSPVIVDLIGNGFFSHLAVNGAVLIHDYEFAFYGRSSEDVDETLEDGMFGMVDETPRFLNSAVAGSNGGDGLAYAIATAMINDNPPDLGVSVLAAAMKREIPVTAHINLGSSVTLPEVFLKALNVARNIYGEISSFSAANIDMIQHYRPVTNVVARPTLRDGKRYTITGHFEILIPLIAWGLKTAK